MSALQRLGVILQDETVARVQRNLDVGCCLSSLAVVKNAVNRDIIQAQTFYASFTTRYISLGDNVYVGFSNITNHTCPRHVFSWTASER